MNGTKAAAAEEMRRLAQAWLPHAPAVAARITERVVRVVPELAPAGRPEAVELVRESTDQNIGAMISTMAFGITPTSIEPPTGTQDLLDNLTAGGRNVTHLLRAYRVGHELLWRLWSAHVHAAINDPVLLPEVLDSSSTHLFDFIDRICQRVVAVAPLHHGGHGDNAGATSRQELVRLVLSPEPIEVAGISSRLGYDLSGYHVALVAGPITELADVRGELDRVIQALSVPALTVPAGDGRWWAWLGYSARPTDDHLIAVGNSRLAEVVIGASEPYRGRDGFKRSLAQAQEASRVARLNPDVAPGVIRYRAVEIAAILCADPDRARTVAAERLGPLASRDETGRRLRETLRAVFAHGHNRGAAARTLHIHHKTVAYRISQAEELLGGPISDDTLSLHAALIIDATLHG